MSLKIYALILLGVILLRVWLITQVYYRITRRFLEVRIFGLCLRRIELTDIRRISKHREKWCEKWPNTWLPRKRTLIIQRKSGRFKHFLITPQHRYVFKAELKKMIAKRWEEIDREKATEVVQINVENSAKEPRFADEEGEIAN